MTKRRRFALETLLTNGVFRDAAESKVLSRLRRKFVLITNILVGAVLAIMLAVAVVGNYQVQNSELFQSLNAAVGLEDGAKVEMTIGGPAHGQRGDVAGAVFMARPVFIVRLDAGSGSYDAPGNMVTMDAAVLAEAISRVQASADSSGLILDMSLAYAANYTFADSGLVRIAFADASSLLNTLAASLAIALVIWLVAMSLILVISLFLSRMALRPVVETWQKQRQFIADASHELKTPLTVILANTNIISSSPQSSVGEQSQWLESTQTEAQRMDRLIRDLLFLAQEDQLAADSYTGKYDDTGGDALAITGAGTSSAAAADSGTATDTAATDSGAAADTAASTSSQQDFGIRANNTPLACNFSDIVNGVLLQFDAVLFERGSKVEPTIDAGIMVNGNTEQLDRLLFILLDNASKYSPKGDVIRVLLATEGNNAVLRVCNGGDVIPPDVLKHLFERFYRGDSSRSDTVEGFGLGLSIAESIVTSLAGSIHASSDSTQGTVFTVSLPLAR